MAAPTGGSSKDRKGKKEHKNKPTSKKWEHYKVDGNNIVRGKLCPRCGAGVFLAKHDDRVHCGKCSYTEFTKK